MVFICPQEYSNEDLYKSYFDYFPFELSNWQKWSLQAMVEGNHSLVTAPTGSGKPYQLNSVLNTFILLEKLFILHLLKHYPIKNIMSLLPNILIFHLEF